MMIISVIVIVRNIESDMTVTTKEIQGHHEEDDRDHQHLVSIHQIANRDIVNQLRMKKNQLDHLQLRLQKSQTRSQIHH